MNERKKELERFVARGKGVEFTPPSDSNILREIEFNRVEFMNIMERITIIIKFNLDGTSNIEWIKLGQFLVKTLDKMKTKKIYDKFMNINIDKWKRRYDTKFHICDGEKWNIKLIYNDRKKYCSGLNAYPSNFEMLENWIEYLKKLLKIV